MDGTDLTQGHRNETMLFGFGDIRVKPVVGFVIEKRWSKNVHRTIDGLVDIFG